LLFYLLSRYLFNVRRRILLVGVTH